MGRGGGESACFSSPSTEGGERSWSGVEGRGGIVEGGDFSSGPFALRWLVVLPDGDTLQVVGFVWPGAGVTRGARCQDRHEP